MLVLRRRIGETVSIGENIEITVLSIKGRQVRLGTAAPDEVRIDRKEMRERALSKDVTA